MNIKEWTTLCELSVLFFGIDIHTEGIHCVEYHFWSVVVYPYYLYLVSICYTSCVIVCVLYTLQGHHLRYTLRC